MRVAGFAVALFFGVASWSACSQQFGPAGTNSKQVQTLDVVVTPGANGKPVAGLGQSSFTLLDNGVPQPIRTFRAASGQTEPVKTLIVIDDVNVGYQQVAFERQEIQRFLRANGGHLGQPTALAIFTDTGTSIQPGFTTDGNALDAMLQKETIGLRDIRRSAGFYGAAERLDLSLQTLNRLLARAASEPGRKFILWVTPGWPLLSGPDVQLTNKEEESLFAQVVGFSDTMRASNTTLYVVNPLGSAEGPGRTFYYQEFVKGVKKPSQVLPGNLGIQVLAEQSGGLVLNGDNDITALLQQCVADANSFYEITYQPKPAEQANEYHRIQVRVAEPHLVARTREGYYAQP